MNLDPDAWDFVYEPAIDADPELLLAEIAQCLGRSEQLPPGLGKWFHRQWLAKAITIKRRRGRKKADTRAQSDRAVDMIESLIQQGMGADAAIAQVAKEMSLLASRETIYQWRRTAREESKAATDGRAEYEFYEKVAHFHALARQGITGEDAFDLKHWEYGRYYYPSKEAHEQWQFEVAALAQAKK